MGVRSRLITHAGETKTITEWAMSTGLSGQLIAHRLKQGWSVERALNPERDNRGRRRVVDTTERPVVLSEALDMIYRDMQAHQRAFHRTIRACIAAIEKQEASQQLTIERMLEERTTPPADLGRGAPSFFFSSASDRCLPSTQETTFLGKRDD